MKKIRRSAKQGVALSVALLVLLLTVTGFGVYSYTVVRHKKQSLEEKSAQAMEYVKETEKITQEIEGLKVRIKKLGRTGTQMSMTVFAQCTDNLYEDIFAIANSYKSAGAFVVTKDESIGFEGCITVEQYDEMLEAGWTPAISAPKGKVDPAEDLQGVRANFEKIERDLPKAYYFPEGTFTKENLSFAISEGFTTFFYRVEEAYAKELNTDMSGPDDPVYIPYMFMSVTQKVFEKFDAVMTAGNSCALSTRYAVSVNGFGPDHTTDPEYDSFIENVKDVYYTLTAEYGYDRTVVEFREEMYAAKVDLVIEKDKLQEQINALVRRRDELNQKIVEIYGTDLNE